MRLAEKYRPKTWEDVIGQEVAVEILKSQVESKSIKGGYLISGPSGSGKTTLARIFANTINNGVGTPIEIDAATHNSVDNMRQLIEHSSLQSIDSEYKVYILDEVHMLSTAAWNSALKFLEDTPKNTVLILCTTDSQKIPVTVMSRLHKLNLSRLLTKDVCNGLVSILSKEGCTENKDYLIESVEMIASSTGENMRDAITVLEMCLTNKSLMNVEKVSSLLGIISSKDLIELSLSVLNLDSKTALKKIEKIYNNGFDLKQFVRRYYDFVLDICKYSKLGSREIVNLPFESYNDEISKLSSQTELFVFVLEKLNNLMNQIKWDPKPKTIIESTFLLLSLPSEG